MAAPEGAQEALQAAALDDGDHVQHQHSHREKTAKHFHDCLAPNAQRIEEVAARAHDAPERGEG